MKGYLVRILMHAPWYWTWFNYKSRVRQRNELVRWINNGRPVPPPHIVKQNNLLYYANLFKLDVMVETGTYYGDMIEAVKYYFKKIYSIELSRYLYEMVKARFKNHFKIELFHGDSGVVLSELVRSINQPTLFWLDGHYSSGITAKGACDTPIVQELTHIFSHYIKEHVIIIDDARSFGKDPAYPSKHDLFNFIKSTVPNANIFEKDDSIIITNDGDVFDNSCGE